MKIGFIGAGRVGCSIGKYLQQSGICIAGYYDPQTEAADSAAAFTGSKSYPILEDLIFHSDLLFITTPDSMIVPVWEEIRQLSLAEKVICHCSGALPSDAFAGITETGASGCSFHPMLPFSSRFDSFGQLKHAYFTIEGQDPAVEAVTNLFARLGNTVCRIPGEHKPKYHTAASILSNQVIAVLDTGYRLLEQCGFTREEARNAAAGLIRQNIENVIQQDCISALTGPVERNDLPTVQKHLNCLSTEDRQIYQMLGLKLVQLAEKKNPGQDYQAMRALLNNFS
ncbi:MAG: DUF2520 domain-containing protein [Eubacterium sp.]|nr:DUF2520 domain-containing protein [Eubacterium sp.]